MKDLALGWPTYCGRFAGSQVWRLVLDSVKIEFLPSAVLLLDIVELMVAV